MHLLTIAAAGLMDAGAGCSDSVQLFLETFELQIRLGYSKGIKADLLPEFMIWSDGHVFLPSGGRQGEYLSLSQLIAYIISGLCAWMGQILSLDYRFEL